MGLPHGGVKGPIPKQTAHLVAALRERGVTIETFAWGRHGDDDSRAGRIVSRLADAWRVRRRLAGDTFDVLLVETAHDLTGVTRDLPLSILTQHRVRKRVLQFHGSECDKLVGPGHRAIKLLTRRLIKGWDLILVLSEEERLQWRQFAPGADVRVARNAYVRTMSDPISAERRATSGSATPAARRSCSSWVACWSRRASSTSLRPFDSLVCRSTALLVLVGDGPERQALSQTIMRHGLTPAVSMPGYLAGDELRQAYQDADVFVLPSYREGFPTVIAEAMDAGLPIVTTQIRGAADVLVQETNALFVPPRRPELLAENLVRLLQDDDTPSAHGSRERREGGRVRASCGRSPVHRASRVALRATARAALSALARRISRCR